MKFFRFWVKEKFNISIEGSMQQIEVLAGSNISKQQASDDAAIKAKAIESRIESRQSKDEYEVPIREFVLDEIDDSNIITVCRYGAKVWNTNEYTILDLDDYPIDFLDMFKGLNKLSKKERIVYKFEQRLRRYPILGINFRVYETTKGVRVIGKTYVAPNGREFTRLMRKLSVDWVYLLMSKRQNCYRARLTPKPYRMRIKTFKVKSPMDCEGQAYNDWSKYYDEQSKKFSVVKLIKSIGHDFSSDKAIKVHDQNCNIHANNKLA